MFPLHGGLVLRPMVGDPLRAKKMLHFYFPGLANAPVPENKKLKFPECVLEPSIGRQMVGIAQEHKVV